MSESYCCSPETIEIHSKMDRPRCQFLIGPSITKFTPNSLDIWSFSTNSEYDQPFNSSNSYFIYGSNGGCFNYGQIGQLQSTIFASIEKSINIKGDKSPVVCSRFLRPYASCPLPLAMILTQDDSLVIHNCSSKQNLIHYKKADLHKSLNFNQASTIETSNNKNKPKGFKSCIWPNLNHAFVGMVRERTNLLLWLKLGNITTSISKENFIESCQKLDLDLTTCSPTYFSPMCCLEHAMLDEKTCLIAVALDDGLITVINVHLENGQSNRIIKLHRHNDRVCSMSFFVHNKSKFPLGLLASVSRGGLALVWDVENEFNFADHQAYAEGNMPKNSREIDWFSLKFISSKSNKTHANLVISNPNSGLSIFKIPEKSRSKIRLRAEGSGQKSNHRGGGEPIIRHHQLILDMAINYQGSVIVTASLDGSYIFWSINGTKKAGEDSVFEMKPQYLYPSMSHDARTHMLRFSQIKEDLIAAALGKAGLRFYKIPKSPANYRFDMSPSLTYLSKKLMEANLSPTSIAWHPSNEYRLSVGTLRGVVLRLDLTPNKVSMIQAVHEPLLKVENLQPVASNEEQKINDILECDYQPPKKRDYNGHTKQSNHETDAVYSMCWGPNPNCSRDLSKLAIYAVGSITKTLFIYSSKNESGDKQLTNYFDDYGKDRNLPEAFGQASEVSWKLSLDLMALGTRDGKIIILRLVERADDAEVHLSKQSSQIFNRLAVIQGPLGHTYTQCLAWHPSTNKEDAYYYYIAASANESPAFIFNTKESILVADVNEHLNIGEDNDLKMSCDEDCDINLENSNSKKSNITISEFIKKLDGHKKAITDISWSPHDPNEVATCSFDGHCKVWTLASGGDNLGDRGDDCCDSAKNKSTFEARDRLFTLEWSLVDSDLIFTSGQDSTIWAWRPSQNVAQILTDL